MDFVDLVNNLNDRLEELKLSKSKFNLDKVLSSHPLKTTVLGTCACLSQDQTIVPKTLRIPILMHLHNRKVVSWINKKYEETIRLLCKGKNADYQMLLVRLRIAACMATHDNIIGLTHEEKEEWRQHITKVFYDRNLVMINYYLEEIVKLPF